MFFCSSPIVFPTSLEKSLLAYFSDPQSQAIALQKLWPLLAQEHGQQEKTTHYAFDKKLAQAYAAYYLPINALKIKLLLEENFLLQSPLSNFFQNQQTIHWFDIGCGPGTTLWGLTHWLEAHAFHINYHGFDQSKIFLNLAQEISPHSNKITPSWKLLQNPSELIKMSKITKPHIISFMNSIGELFPSVQDRILFLEKLIAANPHAWLIIIEPGTRFASRELLEVREFLRQHKDIKIWLPCLNNRPCGAFADKKDWCHEEVACQFPDWINKLGQGAGLKKEALIFSYLVSSIGKVDTPKHWPSEALRMVSQRLERKGYTECHMCTNNGKQSFRVLNARTTEANKYFHSIVRGEIFSEVTANEKGDVTSIKK